MSSIKPLFNTLFMFSLYYNSILLLICTKTTTTIPTSVIPESVNSLCEAGTNIPVVTGGVGGVMGVIILTQIVVIVVVLLLRQGANGKANKRYIKPIQLL